MMKAGNKLGSRAVAALLQDTYRVLEVIVASPRIAEYAIWVTGNPNTRQKSYRSVGATGGFVILAWNLDAELTEQIERGLYEQIASAPKNSVVYRKCHDRIKNDVYRRSINKKFREHFVYVSW